MADIKELIREIQIVKDHLNNVERELRALDLQTERVKHRSQDEARELLRTMYEDANRNNAGHALIASGWVSAPDKWIVAQQAGFTTHREAANFLEGRED